MGRKHHRTSQTQPEADDRDIPDEFRPYAPRKATRVTHGKPYIPWHKWRATPEEVDEVAIEIFGGLIYKHNSEV